VEKSFTTLRQLGAPQQQRIVNDFSSMVVE